MCSAPGSEDGSDCLRTLLLQHHVVEAVNLGSGADRQGCALVHGGDLHIQHAVAGNAIGGLAPGHLHEASKRSRFEGQPELGWRGFGGRIREDTLSLGKLLAHVRNQTTRVAKGELVGHVMLDQIVVALHFLSCSHIGRCKDLAVWLDLNLVTRADPLVAISQRELVDTIIQGYEDCRAGAIQCHKAHHLVSAGCTNQSCGLVPHAHNGPYGPVVVHNRAAVKRIPAKNVLAILVRLHNLGLFLRRSLVDKLRGLGEVPQEVVSDDIDRELSIPEGI
mmetsp:Transcript_37777/g.90359  ORF Transcript_37777/g.90359 Transcript_37777/m.90359 type:complete len:277 (-) Transcript_37777:507-1337(-)